MYVRQTKSGKQFEFTEDTETLAGYSLHGNGQAHADGFSLVAKRRLEDWEGIAFGRGQSENPDRAEAYLYFDPASDDADASGSPDPLNGQFEIVILNSADNVIATVRRGTISEYRQGDPDVDKRGEYGKPFKYAALRGGKGEVMTDAYQVGIRLKLDSGTDEIVLGNSTLSAEGYSGRKQN